ncbi:hypothetical protein ALP98_100890 [Pseudomonas viridiflava]|uniref:Uncharacterized protein n=4 Tax=Pseudomonas syringae group TaxID=136849 RepID=A0A7Z6ULJ4_PSESF|nr:hypothetical protein ALO73_100872 [Pseudomonas syringae pv. daphniphylli]RMP05797.1 hypothetical protein ALQ30_100661 [Pseudomonas syringae pv. persicae]RMP80042.1 hypothetical protein ALQ15_103797 [Pseudomonas syringae pv. actinidiae]RMQ14427.1 hypothetical protein ALQ09_100581 [Pseudomonas viridiflava]RMQ73090.1 hypothetical protein ALP98_100890 [Pseudomonas viridiflava]
MIIKRSHTGGQLSGESTRPRQFFRDICTVLSFGDSRKFLS